MPLSKSLTPHLSFEKVREMNTQIVPSKKFLTEKELLRLQDKLANDYSVETLMIEILMVYGMRGGELLRLRMCDLNIENKSIIIRGTKKSKDREFPLGTLFKRTLNQAYEVCRKEKDFVFPYSRFQLMRIWDKYKPTVTKTLHCLRHTAALRIYEQTKDLNKVQKVLGHRSILTTMKYQDFDYTVEVYKEIFDV